MSVIGSAIGSAWGAVTGLIGGAVRGIATWWDTWSNVSGATLGIFAIGGALLGGLALGGLPGMAIGLIGGAVASAGVGFISGGLAGGWEVASSTVEGVVHGATGSNNQEVAEAQEPDHGLPGRDRGSPEREA